MTSIVCAMMACDTTKPQGQKTRDVDTPQCSKYLNQLSVVWQRWKGRERLSHGGREHDGERRRRRRRRKRPRVYSEAEVRVVCGGGKVGHHDVVAPALRVRLLDREHRKCTELMR
jgi:hypothetical protein